MFKQKIHIDGNLYIYQQEKSDLFTSNKKRNIHIEGRISD